MGMCASSWDGWAKLHVNPGVAMGYYFASAAPICTISAYMCTGVRGEGHMYYVVLVPLVIYTVAGVAIIISFWRWGPGIVHHKHYQPFISVMALGMVPVTYVGYWGPVATVPWHNRLHWLVVSGVSTFSGLQYTSAGGLPGEHPAEPRTSIREPVLRSALHALLLLDAESDLALTRSLLEVVCSF